MNAQSMTLDAQTQHETAITVARAMLRLSSACGGLITIEIRPAGDASGLLLIGTNAAIARRAHCVVVRFADSGQFVSAELVSLATMVPLATPGFAFARAGKTCITDTVTINDPVVLAEALRLLGRMKGDDAWAEPRYGQAE